MFVRRPATPCRATHRRAEYSTGFRACTFYLVFKEPAHSEVTFPSSNLRSPSSGELTQNTEPLRPCQHLFSVPRSAASPPNTPSRSAASCAAPWRASRCFPVGSRATRARRTGLPATERSQGTRSKCGPPHQHPGDDVALCGDAGAPGKTFELSGMCPGCQPL